MVVCNDSQSQADMSDIMNNNNQYTTEVVKNRKFVVTEVLDWQLQQPIRVETVSNNQRAAEAIDQQPMSVTEACEQ